MEKPNDSETAGPLVIFPSTTRTLESNKLKNQKLASRQTTLRNNQEHNLLMCCFIRSVFGCLYSHVFDAQYIDRSIKHSQKMPPNPPSVL